MQTLAITATKDRLIVHDFENEDDAIRTLPFIKNWQRMLFDKPKIRYHSTKAEKYWRNRSWKDRVNATRIIYRDGKKYYEYC